MVPFGNKDEFEMKLTEDVLNPDFTTDTREGLQKFVENLIGFYVIMEGIFLLMGIRLVLLTLVA